MQQARKAAADLDANTKSELKLYTGQALSALKSEVANVLTDGVVKQAVNGLAADPDFLGQFAVQLASKWVQDEPIVISTSEADSLKAYFAAKAKDLLDKGVTKRGRKLLLYVQSCIQGELTFIRSLGTRPVSSSADYVKEHMKQVKPQAKKIKEYAQRVGSRYY